jgi:hypothetical protein
MAPLPEGPGKGRPTALVIQEEAIRARHVSE